MAGIFISYRHEDPGGYARRLYDRLSGRFGEGHVFRDIDTIEYGEDVSRSIEQAINSCDVVVAVIGTRWASIIDEPGSRRLDASDDWVRREIAMALRREVHVIPAIVEGAAMPRAADLPADLTRLADLRALEIRNERFEDDALQLIKTLEKVLALPDTQKATGLEQESKSAAIEAPGEETLQESHVSAGLTTILTVEAVGLTAQLLYLALS